LARTWRTFAAVRRGVMSASKLEKALSNLEHRLREDFTREMKRTVRQHLKPVYERLRDLEVHVHGLETRPPPPPLLHADTGIESKGIESKGMSTAGSKKLEDDSEDSFPFGQVVNIDLDAAIAEEAFGTKSLDFSQHSPPVTDAKNISGLIPPTDPLVKHAELSANIVSMQVYDNIPEGDEESPTPMKGRRPSLASEVSESTAAVSTVDSDMVEEPVAFLETAWNLVLVLGHTNSGPVDILIAVVLLVGSFTVQCLFFVILLSENFLGEPFEEQLQNAILWRQTVAHDYKYMDPAQTSLIARVCSGDGKLILSTQQAQLLEYINQFMGLGPNDFEPPMMSDGIMLCMMCILLWCLYLCQEMRAVLFSLEAVSQLPKGPTTIFIRGGFRTIGYLRFAAYCVMRSLRLCIAVGLLYAGVQWLSATISITELILNAVALSAVLQIDEMVFAALMPKKIQICIQDLDAIKVKYSKFRSQTESMMLLGLIMGLLLWPYLWNVGPLGEKMLEVKRAYCDGNQNFVVGFNSDQGVTVGLVTVPYVEDQSKLSVSEIAVADFKDLPSDATSNYIYFQRDLPNFNTQLTQPMGFRAYHDAQCRDWDTIYLTNATHEFQEFYRAHFWSAVLWSELGETANCSEMAQFCSSYDGRLVRNVCPRSCGCPSQYAQPWMMVNAEGCPTGCENELTLSMRRNPCVDRELSEMKTDWDFFWDHYVPYINLKLQTDLLSQASLSWLPDFIRTVKEQGCAGITERNGIDPLLRNTWCEGSDLMYRPLAYLCPQTCGCDTLDPMPSYCPTSCEGCADAAEFPSGLGAITNCDLAKEAGLCEGMPEQAVFFCASTCNLCHLLG